MVWTNLFFYEEVIFMNIFEDPNGFKVRTMGAMFYNSDTLFVEYSDIIRNIDFMVLIMISRMKENFESFLDLDPIYGLQVSSLMEWYMTRKDKNILYELLQEDKRVLDEFSYPKLNEMMNQLVSVLDNESWREICPELNFSNVVKLVEKEDKNFLAHVKIWYPFNNPVIRSDVQTLFGERAQFVFGPIEEVLENVDANSTFVFSDVTNIMIMEDIGKLDYSSILIPTGYQYNDVDGKLKIDIDSYEEDHIFKFNFFDNF